MSDSLKRSHSCGLLTKEAAGEQVVLCGWVAKRRDHGGLIFVDLRDRSGIVQIVVDPDDAGNSFTTAEAIRSEYVIKVAGKVRLRDAATVNPNLATGEIEVVAADLEVLNAAKTPPFYIQDDIDTDENLRLKYRYLDLRRPEMQKNLILRHKVTKLMRDYMDKNGFCEIETPMLTKSTPEGARDYLVPSRVNPGKFYALPQSPQIFKHVDLENDVIDVNHTLVYYDHRTDGSKKGCYFNVNTPKTPAGKRKVLMLSFVKEAIIMEKERQELLDLHCIATIDGYTDFIFINRFGNPQHQGTLNKAIRRIIRDCNDEQFLKNENPEVLLPHFSCHSLRHTFTTRMCEAGVNVKVIQDTLGHKDISTTLNIYTDVTKELRQSEFEGLDSYFKSEYNEVSNE